MAPRYHRAVLEPEVEQVAVHDELVPHLRDRIEEGVEGAGDGGGDLPQVGIGHDEAAVGCHGLKLGNPFDFCHRRTHSPDTMTVTRGEPRVRRPRPQEQQSAPGRADEYPPGAHERNPGIPLDLDLVRMIRVNRSAVERRAATLPRRRTVKKEWQAAWLL